MGTNPATGWREWLVLNPKIKAALAVLIAGNTAGGLAALGGTISWKLELGALVGSVLTTLAGYLTPAPLVAAIKAKVRKPSP